MPPTREEIRRFVRAALRARDRVSRLEDEVLRDALRDVAAARARLLEDLAGGRGTAFQQAFQADLVGAMERVLDGVRRQLDGILVPRVADVAKTADELVLEDLRIAGLEGVAAPVKPFLDTRALAVAQGDYVAALVQRVTNETKDRIGTELRRALAGGQSLEQFAKATLRGLKDPGPFGTLAVRSEAIVRTEFGRTLEMSGQVHRQGLVEAGFRTVKRWVAVRDARTRPSHLALDGVEVGVDELFDVGGEPALFPMDPQLSAEESVHCRCTCVNRIIPPGEEEERP